MDPFTFTIESKINCSKQKLWEDVTQMKNVNYELMPLLRMTYPKDRAALSGHEVPLNTTLFNSILLLFGFLPIDVHFLKLEWIANGEAFFENSSSLLQRYWKHNRTLIEQDEFTIVRDKLEFIPRIPFLGYLVLPIVRNIFKHRHKRLIARYK